MSTFWLNSGGNLVARKSFASTLLAMTKRVDVEMEDGPKYLFSSITYMWVKGIGKKMW